MKFTRLTVIKRDYSDPRNKKQPMWLCRCDCGIEKLVAGYKLRSGSTKSCNCYRNTLLAKERRFGSGYANMRELFRCYKKSAKKRNYKFELEESYFQKLTKENCFYCGKEPMQVKNNKECFGKYIYNGIDRIDNAKGYTIDNVVACCKICNSAKNNMTMVKFKQWIKDIYSKTVLKDY